jgi:putative AlgH/UPF0301 family transcriptional regulator
VLLVKYTVTDGAIGLVLNKVSYVDGVLTRYGGPLQTGMANILHTQAQAFNAHEIVPGLYLGGSVGEGENNDQVKQLKLYGYSGWRSLQLDGEVRAGCWEIEGICNVNDLLGGAEAASD